MLARDYFLESISGMSVSVSVYSLHYQPLSPIKGNLCPRREEGGGRQGGEEALSTFVTSYDNMDLFPCLHVCDCNIDTRAPPQACVVGSFHMDQTDIKDSNKLAYQRTTL